jgi:glycosyltransferase involved in cell wall biosynthesis
MINAIENKYCSTDISVVIPCHNDGKYLAQSAGSVLAQKVNNALEFELLIIDDGSDDPDTQRILQEISLWDNRVKVLHIEKSDGAASARNYGVKNAAGSWVAFLDADDEWLPGSLLDRWSTISQHPSAGLIGADHVLFWDGGKAEKEGFFASRERPRQCLREAFETDRPIILKCPVVEFLESMPVFTGTVLVKKSLFEEVGGFDSRFRQAEDNHLWLRLAANTDFIFLPKVLARYRQRTGSLTATSDSQHLWDYKMLRDLKKQNTFSDYRPNIEKRVLNDLKEDVWFQRKNLKWSRALHSSLIVCSMAPHHTGSWRLLLSTALASLLAIFRR